MLESGIRICEKWIPAQILKTDDPAQYLPAVHRTRGVLSYCIGTVEDILFLSLSLVSLITDFLFIYFTLDPFSQLWNDSYNYRHLFQLPEEGSGSKLFGFAALIPTSKKNDSGPLIVDKNL